MSVKKKANNPKEKWAKHRNRHFTERKDQMANGEQDAQTLSESGKGKFQVKQLTLMHPQDQ